MNITVKKDASKETARVTGGGCAEIQVEITIDPDMTDRQQVLTLFHEWVEACVPCLPHDKIEEMTEGFDKGLDQLEGE